MSKLPIRAVSTCSAAVAAALLAIPASVHATNDFNVYSYAAKAFCENEEGEELESTINIHNPSLTQSADIKIKTVAIPDEGQGTPSVASCDTLKPDHATSFEVECEQPGDFFEGFVVVLSRKPLDVIGFYETTFDGELEDTDVVPVSGRKLNTDQSAWNRLSCPDNSPD
jgi:hypothetical protein